MDRAESSRRDAVLDAVSAETERQELRARDDAVLRVRERGHREVDGVLTGHIPVKPPGAEIRPLEPATAERHRSGVKRFALIVLLALSGCGGEQRAVTSCSPPPVHRGDDGVWIEAQPEELRLVGALGYWPEDWDDVERAQVFTVGNGPDGIAAKTMWIFRAPDLKGEGGSHMKIEGRNLDGGGTFEQTNSAVFYEGQNGAPSYASTLDLPNAGCWRLTLTTDDLEATVDIRAVD